MTLDNRHTIALPYWARPGIRLFAKRADDNDVTVDVDDEDDELEDDGEDDDDDPDEGKSEDELRAELKAVRASLGKANGQSARNRKRRRELEAQLAAKPVKKAKRADDDEDDELDVESIREQARREGEKAGNDRVKRAEVRAALAKAGVRDEKALARLAAGVNLDDLDLDDDGNVEGLDDVIDDLREDLPALFATQRRRRDSVAGQSDRDGDRRSDRKPKTASEIAAERVLGRGKS